VGFGVSSVCRVRLASTCGPPGESDRPRRQVSTRLATGAPAGKYKGVGVALALDGVRVARETRYDVAPILSPGQGLSEAAVESEAISVQQSRWMKAGSGFPVSPTTENSRPLTGGTGLRAPRVGTARKCLNHEYLRLTLFTILGMVTLMSD
jgi:hypothetical protein